MTNRIRMLLLDTNDAVGGVVSAHLMFLRLTDRTRFDVYAAVHADGPLLPQFQAVPDVTLWTVAFGTKSARWCQGWRARVGDAWGLLLLLGAAVRLAVRCRRAGIQVIHTSDKKRSLLLTLLLHRLTGIPYLYHIHAEYVAYRANRLALARAAAIVANSEAMRWDCIAHVGPGMERIRVVHNGIDTDRFSPGIDDSLRREVGAAPDDVLIGITGRLAPAKGQETFLQAAARVAVVEPRARFVIVGDDSIFSDNADYVPRLQALAGSGALAGRVRFLGFRRDMVSITRGLDIVVVASWLEAFGLVVIEAMACGKPVLGTHVGGIPEIITDHQDGFLFPVRDDARLAERMLDLVRAPVARARLGAAARQTAVERFDIRRQIRTQERLYAEIAKNAERQQT